jgi:hypothetical protein
MNLSGYKKAYEDLSGLASTVSRQLALAGIAVIWIFKAEVKGNYCLSTDLLMPSWILVFGLTCDLLQYVCGAIIWGSFHRHHEKNKSKADDDPYLLAPHYFNWPANTFFILKIASVITAYIYLLNFIWRKIQFV